MAWAIVRDNKVVEIRKGTQVIKLRFASQTVAYRKWQRWLKHMDPLAPSPLRAQTGRRRRVTLALGG